VGELVGHTYELHLAPEGTLSGRRLGVA
jgi:hypothetical protein